MSGRLDLFCRISKIKKKLRVSVAPRLPTKSRPSNVFFEDVRKAVRLLAMEDRRHVIDGIDINTSHLTFGS